MGWGAVALPHSLRALASPNFRRYYIGQTVSMIGTWVRSVAVMWLAYRLSGSTWFTGLIGFLNTAPHLFLAPFAGVLGDRVSRRKMLMTVLSLMAIQSTVLAVLSGLGIITMPQLAPSRSSRASATPSRRRRANRSSSSSSTAARTLPNAIALNSMLMNGTRSSGLRSAYC